MDTRADYVQLGMRGNFYIYFDIYIFCIIHIFSPHLHDSILLTSRVDH